MDVTRYLRKVTINQEDFKMPKTEAFINEILSKHKCELDLIYKCELTDLNDNILNPVMDRWTFINNLCITYGSKQVLNSSESGGCVVCGAWPENHHEFIEYDISTCVPQNDLQKYNPDNRSEYIGKYKYDLSENDQNQLIYQQDLAMYQLKLQNQCVNQINQLLNKPLLTDHLQGKPQRNWAYDEY